MVEIDVVSYIECRNAYEIVRNKNLKRAKVHYHISVELYENTVQRSNWRENHNGNKYASEKKWMDSTCDGRMKIKSIFSCYFLQRPKHHSTINTFQITFPLIRCSSKEYTRKYTIIKFGHVYLLQFMNSSTTILTSYQICMQFQWKTTNFIIKKNGSSTTMHNAKKRTLTQTAK